MNGAEALLRTLLNCGVDVCIGNPGTPEMHFVAALDAVPEMRGVLGLFEGAVAGAADGYGRIAGRPAVTLGHCGPGLGNAIANFHNARRAHTPIVSVVGDHATTHRPFDAPLGADVEGLARTVSKSVQYLATPEAVGYRTRLAVEAAMSDERGIATLILPADVGWTEGATTSPAARPATPRAAEPDELAAVAAAVKLGARCTLVLGGSALTGPALHAVHRIAAATGVRVITEMFPARARRGRGVPGFRRFSYIGSHAAGQLAGSDVVVLLDTRRPVSFFGYPGQPSEQLPPDADLVSLSSAELDVAAVLHELAEGFPAAEVLDPPEPTGYDPGAVLTPEAAAWTVASTLPEDAHRVRRGGDRRPAVLPRARACPGP